MAKHGELLSGEPAVGRGAGGRARPARGRRPAAPAIHVRRAARGADAALRPGVRLARAHGPARPTRRQPAGLAPRRGLDRLRTLRGRGRTRAGRRHRRAPGPRRTRRAGRTALPGLQRVTPRRPGPGRPRPPARAECRRDGPHPRRRSSGPCRTAATCGAAPTATSGCPRRPCGGSAGRCCGTPPSSSPAGRAAATRALPGRPGSRPAPAARGSSATPSPGTSPAP